MFNMLYSAVHRKEVSRLITEPEYPGMDDHFRYDVEEFFLFGERPVLPNGDLGPVEVRVSFYMDGLCWYELENSPIWKNVADHVRGHQKSHTHLRLLGPEDILAAASCNSQSGVFSRRKKALFDGYRCAFSSIRSLFQRLRKG